mmetsp:Transcript_12432/g.26224  ORF Transcript_12432/g.26224 Transcript_12432/m.26224 type:complete len:250 (+) Transcript_12432:992-1741(+)
MTQSLHLLLQIVDPLPKSRLPLDHKPLQLLPPLHHGLILLHLLLRMLHGQIVHVHLVLKTVPHAFRGVDFAAQCLQLGGEFLGLGLETVSLGGERVDLALEGGQFVLLLLGGGGASTAMTTAAVVVDGLGHLTGRFELLLEGVVSVAVVEGGGSEGQEGEEEECGENGGKVGAEGGFFWFLVGIFGRGEGGGSVGGSGGCICICGGRSGRGKIIKIISRSCPAIDRAVDPVDTGRVSLRRRLPLSLRLR